MRVIGGFLGLEPAGGGGGPHHDVPALSTGRSCLRYIIEAERPRRVHVPFYVCDALLVSLRKAGVEYRFYGLDHRLAPASPPDQVKAGELYVCVNYLGLMGSLATALGATLKEGGVVDDSQAFFRRGAADAWSFNSARKFLGVPDGAYLYGPASRDVTALPRAVPTSEHLTRALDGDGEVAYRLFRLHEASLDDGPRGMSELTARLMEGIDYARVAARRRANYLVLDGLLTERNRLCLSLEADDVPLYYPFLPPARLREELIRRGVFVPSLWPEVASRPGDAFAWERELATLLCPLPVDQRYDAEEMRDVAARVKGAVDA